MAYIGNSPVAGENNSFKILDDISTYTLTFDGSSSSVVSTSDNTITYNSHRFITAQRVTYNDGGGTAIGGLADGVYYIIKNDQNTIKLATSEANANAGTAISLTSLGVGSSHTLNVAFDGVNTKFKATYDNGTKAEISRAAQLTLSVNGVIQQPNDSTTPTNGFGFDLDSVIIFSVAPAATDAFWGNLVANNFPTFDISDNTIDNFTGDNSTVDFTLSKTPANNQNILVTLDGVIQYPSDANNTRAYSVTNNILTFVSAPGSSVAIQVRHIGFAGAVTSAVTGFYGRTGNVGLSTSDNAEVLTLKVGTGTTFTEDLVVQGDARVTGILTIGTASLTLDGTNNQIKIGTGITLTESGGAEYSGIITATTLKANGGNVRMVDTNGSIYLQNGNTTNGAKIGVRGTSDATDGYLAFETNSIEFARFDSSGNFGIGTNAPTYNLDVESNGNTVIRARSSTTANPSIILSEDNNTKWQFESVNNSDNRLRIVNQSATEVVTVEQSGNVGIGTESAGDKLVVHQGTDDDIIIRVNGADSTTEFAGLGVGPGYASVVAGGSGTTDTDLVFMTSNAGTEAGRWGINETGILYNMEGGYTYNFRRYQGTMPNMTSNTWATVVDTSSIADAGLWILTFGRFEQSQTGGYQWSVTYVGGPVYLHSGNGNDGEIVSVPLYHMGHAQNGSGASCQLTYYSGSAHTAGRVQFRPNGWNYTGTNAYYKFYKISDL